jgi:uncharacterized small protein (DUF1192 family)
LSNALISHKADDIRSEPQSMTDPLSVEELDRRIAILRENLRQLIEQAAARSGAADEALASDRITQQSDELDRLTKERDALQAAQGRKA